MIDNFRIAVKAFIVSEGKLLLIKRADNDTHKPGVWDIPGGRLDIGESPLTGVAREALEETGLEINVVMPIDVHHFTRDDGQNITMIIFLCTPKNTDVRLSEEHTEFNWKNIDSPINEFPEWLYATIKNYLLYIIKNTK